LGKVLAKMEEPARGLSMGSFASHGNSYRIISDLHRLQGFGLPQPWEQRAACQDTEIELWFGRDSDERGKRPFRTTEQTAQAKRICISCPVLDECRQWSMETGFPYGIVGAMTEAERKRLWAEGEAAWQEFWRAQDKALGRRKRMGGNHNGNKTHCKHGHEYTQENTYTSGSKRFCVTCRNIRNKQYQQRKREELGDWLWNKQRQNGHLTG
jgi:WhiB family redox-sensing transcriptional regulator